MRAGQALIVQRTLMNVSATRARMGGAAPMGSMATPASAPAPGQDHSARLPSKVQPEPPPAPSFLGHFPGTAGSSE